MALDTSDKYPFEVMDFFQIRSPSFPIEVFQHLKDSEENILLAANHPLSRRAIMVSSLSLFDELNRQSLSIRDSQRRERKLMRYLIRMSTRPTPYGLFAGVAIGSWNQQTTLEIQECAATLQVRPDMEWLLELIWQFESVPLVRQHLIWTTNSAIYHRNDRIYVIDPIAAAHIELNLVPSIRETDAVRFALELAYRPMSYANLHEALLNNVPKATSDKVNGLLDQLWQYGFILSNLRPIMTGTNNLASVLHRIIINIAPLEHYAQHLSEILETITLWENMHHEGADVVYSNLMYQMKMFLHDVTIWARSQQHSLVFANKTQEEIIDNSKQTIQVDACHMLIGAEINHSVANEIARMASILDRLALPQVSMFPEEFRRGFLERYGDRREVPLLDILNPYFGLGAIWQHQDTQPQSWQHTRDRVLLEIASTALHDGRKIIELDDALLSRLEIYHDSNTPLAPSFDLNVFVAAPSREAVDQGDFKLIIGPNFGGHQGGRNFGRFASMIGDKMLKSLSHLARIEEESYPDALWAELVYLPYRSRSANVALRPSLRTYEITFGVQPSVDLDHVIPIDELVIGIQKERFYLRWPKHDREVRITVGHMLNAQFAPDIIRFLEYLAIDGTRMPTAFNWGAANAFLFLPRIQSGRCIISLAKWRIPAILRESTLPINDPEVFLQNLAVWRERWKVPRYIYLVQADNRLLLDLEIVSYCQEIRVDLAKLPLDQSLILEEALPGPEDVWLPGPSGHYMLELNVPLVRRQTLNITQSQSKKSHFFLPSLTNAQRQAVPGSDWLFLKLYCSQELQDGLLAGPIFEFTQKVLRQKLADNWFFIRYADPDPHIRLRFHGHPDVMIYNLFPILCQWSSKLMSEGPCTRFTFDVYDREIERYGGIESLEACERIFGADSRFVVGLLHQKMELDNLIITGLSTDILLATLERDSHKRLAFYRERAGKSKDSGKIFRQFGRQLSTAIQHSDSWYLNISGGDKLKTLLEVFSQECAYASQALLTLKTDEKLYQTQFSLFSSLIHMHCNRLLNSKTEREELVIGLLLRIYEGWEARKRSFAEDCSQIDVYEGDVYNLKIGQREVP